MKTRLTPILIFAPSTAEINPPIIDTMINTSPAMLAVLLLEHVPMIRLSCRRFHDFAPGKHFLPRALALTLIAQGRAKAIEESELS